MQIFPSFKVLGPKNDSVVYSFRDYHNGMDLKLSVVIVPTSGKRSIEAMVSKGGGDYRVSKFEGDAGFAVYEPWGAKGRYRRMKDGAEAFKKLESLVGQKFPVGWHGEMAQALWVFEKGKPITAKREEINRIEYLVNPSNSEFWGFFDRNKFKVEGWNEGDESDGFDEEVWFVRGALDEKRNLYVWNPYEVNHGRFANFLGLDYIVPIYITKDKMVYVSDYGDYQQYLPPKIGDDWESLMGFIWKSRPLKSILGSNFAIDLGTLY